MSDLQLAYETLKAKNTGHTLLWDYYEGRQPLRWSSEKMAEIFAGEEASYVLNWCQPIVDAVANRLTLEGFNVTTTAKATGRLTAIADESGLAIEADDVHREACITGESFVIAWPDATGVIEAYHNDSRLCHAFYQADSPRKMRFAAKWWDSEDGHRRITLYYPDRLEYWRSVKQAKDLGEFRHEAWDQVGAAENTFGAIPVFHFRLPKSELQSALPIQDIVNKTLSDLVISGEFAGFPQRYVVTRAEFKKLSIRPTVAWRLPANEHPETEPTQVGQFETADLKGFLDTIDNLALWMGAITHTPKHLFWGQSGNVSGEALIALESPLVKKVTLHQNRLYQTWRELGAFLLQLDGLEVQRGEVAPIFSDARTVQPLTQSMIRMHNAAAGIPLKSILRDEGWTEEELDQLEEDQRGAASTIDSLTPAPLPQEPTQ